MDGKKRESRLERSEEEMARRKERMDGDGGGKVKRRRSQEVERRRGQVECWFVVFLRPAYQSLPVGSTLPTRRRGSLPLNTQITRGIPTQYRIRPIWSATSTSVFVHKTHTLPIAVDCQHYLPYTPY